MRRNIVVVTALSVISLLVNSIIYAQTDSAPPGVIINHIPKSAGIYVGSPSICILPNGDYVASHDEFGPNSSEWQSARTRIYISADKGINWKQTALIDGQFWSNLFYHKGALYIMGTNKHHGNLIIRKSDDNGKTWTIPFDSQSGLLLEGEYHTAPVPMLIHNGRIWRAVEYATAKSSKWGERYSATMISAPVNADLLCAKNWRRSNSLYFNAAYLNGNFKGWLEGNAVLAKNGKIANILRVHAPDIKDEYCAVVFVEKGGRRLSFQQKDFYKMPGASKKFTIRYDIISNKYWSIVNYIQDRNIDVQNDRLRNCIALVSSSDLKEWTVNEILMAHHDHLKHGFQYIDWQFDGNNIVYVSRTAYDDDEGGAANYHNANYLTFNFVKDFRKSRHLR